MRISGTEPSSEIISRNSNFKIFSDCFREVDSLNFRRIVVLFQRLGIELLRHSIVQLSCPSAIVLSHYRHVS